ncbi:MAG: pyrimidine-nucleoside phosphorylase [Epulopiscium sp.]|nr:pyrimidine-nucleoside phosphorylase [Candidatus Epulonipiscium sp.]
MNMVELIIKKREGKELSQQEIEKFIQQYIKDEIEDYQVSALLMAICFQGLNQRETADLTMAMVNSGDQMNLEMIPGVKVDKHSTGGVADTTTLILAPLVASCGVPVMKMSGRGLGFTGGTLDKLEAIPGFNPYQSMEKAIQNVQDIGIAIIGQTHNMVPADKKLYALRDVTGTVDQLSLIASSIMSKKIASGADGIVLDVKVGSGAFMNTEEQAFALAKEMVQIGKNVGRKTVAIITDMNQPLGMAVGNALEVKEAIQVLRGEVEGPLKEVSLLLGSHMLHIGGYVSSLEEGKQKLEENIQNGKGALKLADLIRLQGGDERVITDYTLLPQSKEIIPFLAQQDGYISSMKAQEIGKSSMLLGAGRMTMEDIIDPAVGLVMKKRVGDPIRKGEVIAEFYVNKKEHIKEAMSVFERALHIQKEAPPLSPYIHGMVTGEDIK